VALFVGKLIIIRLFLYIFTVKVYMPEMGEGEGTVLKWYKQEGDIVLKDDVLCDIETKVKSDI
jgi:pyruvate/2-oxoglutarate dehydrogenase complex dihydrolipoamide acyltransferase (E2) component